MKLSMRSTVLLLTLLAVPLASWYFVFRPQNAQIRNARKEIEHKELLLAKLREETARNDDLARANEDIKDSVAAIEARLPSGKEIDSVVRQVSELAVGAGLQAPAMKSAKPVPAAYYMEQPLEMTIDGDFSGFFAFLVNLEKLQRITRLPDMTLKTIDQRGAEMRAEFTLSIYFQTEGGSKP